MTGQCICCGRTQELRLGVCWDCAEAESVIEDGTDMRDVAPPKIEGLSMSMSKLQYILRKYMKITTTPPSKLGQLRKVAANV